MKKFLKLKKSIIDSKDEPLLTQIYIDSIRSSCYKIAEPHVLSSAQSCIQSQQSKLSPTDSNQSISMLSKQAQNSVHKINQYTNKIEDIIETIESACKSEQHRFSHESQIIGIILQQLSILQSNTIYKEPINLIRKIIENLPTLEQYSKFLESATPAKHSKKISNYRAHSLVQDEDQEQSLISDSVNKQNHNLNSNCIKKFSFQNPLLQKFKELQSTESFQSSTSQTQQENPKIVFKAYSPGEEVQGESIYLDAESDEQQQEDEQNASQNTFSESQSIQEDILIGLEKITEKDEEESVESNLDKNKDSIQMKKIMYMLESSTQKKVVEEKSKQISRCSKKLSDIHGSPEQRSDRTVMKVIKSSRISLEERSDQKTKTIKDIVKLLDKKYNRTVKFQK